LLPSTTNFLTAKRAKNAKVIKIFFERFAVQGSAANL